MSERNSARPLSDRLREITAVWARSQHQLVVVAAEFAESGEWAFDGSPTAAHWLASVADVEICTAREWIRVGRRLRGLPIIAEAFALGQLSYSKVRLLTRVADPDNEPELADIALEVPAGWLRRALAAWIRDNTDPAELTKHQERQRSVRWRTEPDGMVTFTLRLPPLLAGTLIAALTAIVMRSGPRTTRRHGHASAVTFPSVAQQYADALEQLLAEGVGSVESEVIVHVRGDGSALDDGTPVTDTVVERIAPESFIRTLIHDANGRPINASSRRRHPNARQKRVVKERDRCCVDCGRQDLLEYDHVPDFAETGRTVVEELQLRCAPCHHKRHAA